MQTIVGPMRGVQQVREARLEVRHTETGWRILWVQPIREEAGWDELVVGTSDKTDYATAAEAMVGLKTLLARGERSPA